MRCYSGTPYEELGETRKESKTERAGQESKKKKSREGEWSTIPKERKG